MLLKKEFQGSIEQYRFKKEAERALSALPPIPDILIQRRLLSFVPINWIIGVNRTSADPA
jgi:hypothetical protein